MKLAPLAFAWLALTAPAALAQLTVGPAGSGAQFTQIADAIAAASPNATVEVAPGTYEPFVVDKPLTVLGAPTLYPVSIFSPQPPIVVQGTAAHGGAAILVESTAANTEVHLIGLFCRRGAAHPDGLVSIRNCAGAVRLTNVVALPDVVDGPALRVAGSDGVFCDGCCFGPNFGLFVNGGGVELPAPPTGHNTGAYITSSVFRATNSSFLGAGYPFSDCSDGEIGVLAYDSDIELHRCWARGGEATGSMFPEGCQGVPGVGIWANGGSLRLTGGPATWIFGVQSNLIEPGAGSGPIGGGVPTTAKSIRLNDFVQFRCAPDVRVRGGASGDVFVSQYPPAGPFGFLQLTGGSSTVTIDPAPYPVLFLEPPVVRPGDQARLVISGNPLALHAVYLSPFAGGGSSLPGVEGTVALLPQTTIPLGLFGADAAGYYFLNAPLPPDPLLAGLELHVQSAEISGAGIRLSNLATLVVTP